ncbi:MAG: hypothetical protein IT306_21670 [Chloroflexi bacterium]|nr:hypothetical protein [Chloroflexota bacterium]
MHPARGGVIARWRLWHFRLKVDEPEPGRVMTESDLLSTMVTTWTLTPLCPVPWNLPPLACSL